MLWFDFIKKFKYMLIGIFTLIVFIDPRFLIIFIFGLIFVLIVYGVFSSRKQYKFIQNLDITPLRSADVDSEGLFLTEITNIEEKILTSPISNEPCVAYKIELQNLQFESGGGSTGANGGYKYRTFKVINSTLAPILKSGSRYVFPISFHQIIKNDPEATTKLKDLSRSEVENLLPDANLNLKDERYVLLEHIIKEGKEFIAGGSLQEREAREPIYSEAYKERNKHMFNINPAIFKPLQDAVDAKVSSDEELFENFKEMSDSRFVFENPSTNNIPWEISYKSEAEFKKGIKSNMLNGIIFLFIVGGILAVVIYFWSDFAS